MTVPGFEQLGRKKSSTSRRKKVLGKRKDPQSMPKNQFELKVPTYTFSPKIESKDDDKSYETNNDVLEFERAFGKQEIPAEKQKGTAISKNPFEDLQDSSEDEDVVKSMYTLARPTFSFKTEEEEKEETEVSLDTSDLQLSEPIFKVISSKKKKKKNRKNRKRRTG